MLSVVLVFVVFLLLYEALAAETHEPASVLESKLCKNTKHLEKPNTTTFERVKPW